MKLIYDFNLMKCILKEYLTLTNNIIELKVKKLNINDIYRIISLKYYINIEEFIIIYNEL
jgi:hypothetical protein